MFMLFVCQIQTHTHTHFTPFDLVLINATPDFSIFGELTGIVIWDPYQLPYVWDSEPGYWNFEKNIYGLNKTAATKIRSIINPRFMIYHHKTSDPLSYDMTDSILGWYCRTNFWPFWPIKDSGHLPISPEIAHLITRAFMWKVSHMDWESFGKEIDNVVRSTF